MWYTINNKHFWLADNVRDDDDLRREYYSLTRRVMGFDFDSWYQAGFWEDRHLPHVLVADDGRIVANITVHVMHYRLNGLDRKYLQLSSIITDAEYRHKGMSRFIMNEILKRWNTECDAIYTYATNDMVDYFPRFGFKAVKEYCCFKNAPKPNTNAKVRKLDVNLPADRELLKAKYQLSNPFSGFTLEDGFSLLMIQATGFMRDYIYYVEDYDAVVIAHSNMDVLRCCDIFCRPGLSFNDIMEAVITPEIRQLNFGFTPKDPSLYASMVPLRTPNSTLFVMQSKENVFDQWKVMLPYISYT